MKFDKLTVSYLSPSNWTWTKTNSHDRKMSWIQKSKSKRQKKHVINQSPSFYERLHLSTHYIPSILTNHLNFQNLSIFIIHILIPRICTMQWYLWPSLLELWSILVRHLTSQDHTMSTRHIELSARCWERATSDWSWNISRKQLRRLAWPFMKHELFCKP